MTRHRRTFRQRVEEIAALHAREEQYIRERHAKYPPRSHAQAEEYAQELARHRTPRCAMQRYSELFGMPTLMMLPSDLSSLDPLWEKAIKRGRAASLREMWAVLGWKYPPDPNVVY
jgi:hypothetical protein